MHLDARLDIKKARRVYYSSELVLAVVVGIPFLSRVKEKPFIFLRYP